MITPADAMAVMRHVAACHHRTAPRLDDEEVAIATARIWAKLFNEYKLELPDLLKAVEKRAARFAEAPEPAEIIQYAREVRQQRTEKESDAERAAREARNSLKVIEYDEALKQIAARTGQRAIGRGIGEAS